MPNFSSREREREREKEREGGIRIKLLFFGSSLHKEFLDVYVPLKSI